MADEKNLNTKTKSFFLSIENHSQFTMHYEIVKNILPRTTLYIHGNLASNRWWYPLLNEIDFANKMHAEENESKLSGNMILAEFRGCGQSSAPSSEEEVSMRLFANDYFKLIEHLELANNKINIVGHSTGGNIAALMTSMKPELFHKSLLLDPVGPRGVVFAPRMIETFERMKTNKDLVAFVMGQTIYHNNPNSNYFKDMIVPDAFSAVKSVGHLILKSFNGFNIESELKNNPVETLVLHGEKDLVLDIKESEYMAQILPKGTFKKIPNHGHCLNIESPKLFHQIMSEFFN